MPTRSSSETTSSLASDLFMWRTCESARLMLRSMVRCGKRLNCWKTMPTSERIFSTLRRSLLSSTPSMMIVPSSWGSSRLSVRRKVDFPEPEGPMMTTTSRSRTVVDTPRRAWKSPNHFLTSRHWMISCPSSCFVGVGASVVVSSVIGLSFSNAKVALQLLAGARHREGDNPVYQRDEEQGLGVKAEELLLRRRNL